MDELLERFYATNDACFREIEDALLALAQPRIRAFLRDKQVRSSDVEYLCCARLHQELRNSRPPGGRPIENWDKYVLIIALNVAENKLLEHYYAADPAQAEKIEAELLGYAEPHIRRFLESRGAQGEDLEDMFGETCGIHLLPGLRNSRAPDSRPIEKWNKYVITLTFNVFLDFWRRRKRAEARFASSMDSTRRGDDGPESAPPASTRDIADAVIDELVVRELWGQLWEQICARPPLQRAALLLHLEQNELLCLGGTKSRVARALGIPLSEFREAVWPDLPLSDRKIAARLEVTDQGKTNAEHRVSNLRGCALRRLRPLDPRDAPDDDPREPTQRHLP